VSREVAALHELDEFEDELVARFRDHPVLAHLTELSDDDFAAVLLHRRFVSLAFTPAYDLAIDLLQDETALRIARVILREEYPDGSGHTRSHREDMKADLFQLGITRRAFVETRPTAATQQAITDVFGLIAESGRRDDADLRLVTLLRFWGEVLVSVEYTRMWERMEPLLVADGDNRSRFYYPHHIHDAKVHPLATVSLLSSTHSDRLAMRLNQLLVHEPSAGVLEEVEEQIVRFKESFYDQFLPALGPLAD
jgi:hypothetical protein